jgi:multidrug efflux pump subunit AcrA (membrane-fusion protein)
VLENTTVDLIVTGSASEGDDYEEIEASVRFPTGSTVVDLPVQTLLDDVLEPDETVNIQLQPLFGGEGAYALGSETSAELTIVADTDVPTLSMEPTPKIVTEGQTSQFVITADRASNDPIEIAYTVSGSASPKDDYVELDGEVTLPPGATQVAVTIQTEPDRIVEADETVSVFLAYGEDYRIEAPTGGTVMIESVDLPELSLAGGGDVVEGGAAVFTVVADEPVREATSINYSVNGTAMPGVDFEGPTGVVIMPAGASSVSIVIPIVDDDAIFQPGDMVVADWPARVGQVAVEEGQLVLEGEPIMEFVEDDFSINVTVNAVDRPELSEGLPASVELAATGETVDGSLSRLDESATLEETTEVYEGEVEAEGDLTAIDGAQVNVDVILAESVDAIVVPVAAILLDGQGNPQVRVVDPDDGTIRRISVETGLTEGSYVEVTEGLTGSERVIVQIEDAVEEDSGVKLEGEGGAGDGSGGTGGAGGSSSTEGGGDGPPSDGEEDPGDTDGGGDSTGEDTGGAGD